MNRVAIRLEASAEIGVGHFMRCLTLANALATKGTHITFVMREALPELRALLNSSGHSLCLLPESGPQVGQSKISDDCGDAWQLDAMQTSTILAQAAPIDWLIVDHYRLDGRWERLLRGQARHVLAIDDLADRRHDCDVILDQNLHENSEQRYNNLTPASCTRLIGPDYALLRPEFAEHRATLRLRDGTIRRILVFLGGGDFGNETSKVITALESLRLNVEIDIVVGSAYPHFDALQHQVLHLNAVRLFRQAQNMAKLMSTADLALGAGGSATWERACLGLPTIAIGIAENQYDSLRVLSGMNALVDIGHADKITSDDIASKVSCLMRSPAMVRNLSKNSLGLTDGKGCIRVIELLEYVNEQ